MKLVGIRRGCRQRPYRCSQGLLWLALVALGPAWVGADTTASAPHPFDPLSTEELARAAALVRGDQRLPAEAWLASVDLAEPPKALMLGPDPLAVPRRAAVVVLDARANRTFEVEVDLGAGRVTAWKQVPGVQPPILLEEYTLLADLVVADPRWQAAMRQRGFTDFSRVVVDGWAPGPAVGARLMGGLTYVQGEQVNYYGRPVEGLVAVVDMNARRVVEVIDQAVVPVAARSSDFSVGSLAPARSELPPLHVVQPKGVGYRRDGWSIEWDRWRLRFGLHPREGLVLRDVRWVEGNRARSVLYRASLSEMAVPYGDPTAGTWSWRAAFDVGEYGLGRLATALGRGVDVPDNAELLDVAMVDSLGASVEAPDRIAIYERDGGVAWRHFDWNTGAGAGRRARELVIAFASAIGNYDYLFHWVFHQNGELSMEVALSGILLPKGTAATTIEAPSCPGCTGHLVAPQVEAPNHQHFFSFRLDLDVDGAANSLLEANVDALPQGRHNPDGNGFAKVETVLGSEMEARRDVDARRARMWRVIAPESRNRLGNRSGYMLMPGSNAWPFLTAGNSTRQRARFLDHHLWGTRYHDGELWAAGDYPNQSAVDSGLSRFIANDESLEGQDLVLWYTLGITHTPREEEWPIMNVHRAGFTLVPAGFFDHNPALDLAPEPTARVAFDRLAELVGTWQAQLGDGRVVPVEIRLTAGGSALVETWTMSETRESLTIYTVDGDRLMATHYCPQGNQPRLLLEGVDEDGAYRFAFVDGTALQDPGGEHLEHMSTRIDGPDRFIRRERYVANGTADHDRAGNDAVLVFTRAESSALSSE